MRPNCFLVGYTRFPSYQRFNGFEAWLHQKLTWHQLRPVARDLTRVDDFAAPEARYSCAGGSETWELAAPDNAWRGYFLPLAQAAAYRRRLRRSDLLKGVLGLAGAGSCHLAFWSVR